jgi:hypothetical protein
MHPQLTELEGAVIELLLRGDDPVLLTLATQMAKCDVASRESTGVGFFTYFSVPDDTPRVPGKESFAFGDVVANMNGLENGAGFLLFVKNGRIAFLEGFSYDEPWPANIDGFSLRYATGEHRDFAALAREWSP